MTKIFCLKKMILGSVLALVMIFSCMSCITNQSTVNAAESYSMAEQIGQKLNTYRVTQKGKKCSFLPVLQENVYVRAKELATKFSNTRPDGTSFTSVINSKFAVNLSGTMYEIIVSGPKNASADDICKYVEKRFGSTVKGTYNYFGVGYYYDKNKCYISIIFANSVKTDYELSYYPGEKHETRLAIIDGEDINNPKAGKMAGDVNADGKYDSKDAVVVLEWYSANLVNKSTEKANLENVFKSLENGYIKSSEIFKSEADVNEDENINSKDATLILKYYAEQLTK